MPDNEYLEKLKHVIKGKTVIYIDAANFERSVQDMWVNPKDVPDSQKKYQTSDLCWRIDYKKFSTFFHDICSVKTIKFYSAEFSTESHKKFLWFLSKIIKFKLETKPLKCYNDNPKKQKIPLARDSAVHDR